MTEPTESGAGASLVGAGSDADELSDCDLQYVIGGLARLWPERDEHRFGDDSSSESSIGAATVAGAGA